MRYTGRIFSSIAIFLVHLVYIIYYFFRDGKVEPFDLYTYPLLIVYGYLMGKQYDKMKFYSEKDELTGLYNRRFVIKTFEKIASLTERANSKLFLMVIDCDNFKQINDKYGHHKGDLVLIKIAETLTKSTRKSDIVARWGGDEFLIIGHYKDEEGLQTLLKRLDNDLEKLSNQISLDVKVSIGSAIFPDQSQDLEELIKTADRHMYECKEQRKVL
ncbi:GGDEF domain-containing protein [Brevibacillus borstelensis]|uniref:GGDEF domain-containing protein n=1 Tax=Brevibacillus borstelensis TaxID=45462 RepID=UPI00203E9D98|nr:GGDEF domain-containing protein [Brevibacillus borstelensis]MCM3624335.1 GGDEF domain-containing protein [Brevibacillus borstelensis]